MEKESILILSRERLLSFSQSRVDKNGRDQMGISFPQVTPDRHLCIPTACEVTVLTLLGNVHISEARNPGTAH